MTDVQSASRPVVVGVDGSESALAATRWAAQEAERRHVALRLICAFGWWVGGHGTDARAATDYREELAGSARRKVSAAAALAAQVAPGVAIESDEPAGSPVDLLVAESIDARLVVVGSRGLGGFGDLMIGSVAIGLAAHAACPVVVVRGDPPPGGPVVVGVDGSPTSEAALAFAFEEADARRVPLVAVHTWREDMVEVELTPVIDWAAIETGEHEILAQRLAGWGEKFPDVEVRRVVARSNPTPALIEAAAGAQLVVVGSRGRGTLSGLVLGSVSHALLHHAPCPVAVVRPTPVVR